MIQRSRKQRLFITQRRTTRSIYPDDSETMKMMLALAHVALPWVLLTDVVCGSSPTAPWLKPALKNSEILTPRKFQAFLISRDLHMLLFLLIMSLSSCLRNSIHIRRSFSRPPSSVLNIPSWRPPGCIGHKCIVSFAIFLLLFTFLLSPPHTGFSLITVSGKHKTSLSFFAPPKVKTTNTTDLLIEKI